MRATPLHRLVGRVTAVGLLAQAVALLVVQGTPAVAPLPAGASWLGWAHGWTLVLACTVLTFAGDWVAVRVRRGEETEELTLFEAACVVDVLVLGYCGGSPAEEPYLMISQIATAYYFLHFFVILPILALMERPLPLPFSITEAVLGADDEARLAAQS